MTQLHVHLHQKVRDCGCDKRRSRDFIDAIQDALDQENAREMSGLQKHEWNALQPQQRAEWIEKFKKHRGQ